MKTILFATNNVNKIKEIKDKLSDLGFEVITNLDLKNPPEVVENGTTFLENAQKKAHELADFSGFITIADDSGLMVDKLNGQPGVRSARYAGDHNDARNNAKLLVELGGVPLEKRTATFSTTIVASYPGKFDQDLIVTGEINGQIATVLKGDNGFGYDPLFFVPEKNKTFAEMTVTEKNSLSHRGQAVEKLIKKFPSWYQRVNNNE